MEYKQDFDIDNFPFWSGACDTIKDVREAGKMDELGSLIEEVLGISDEIPTDTQINDFVWFDRDMIYERLGLDENGQSKDEGEDEDEDEDEE